MTLRSIDLTHLIPVNGAVGDAPEIQYVRVTDLVIDDSYQRAIEKRGKRNIQHIAEHFDWAKFSPLMVSSRDDGKFAIIDGQHRA